MKMADLDHVTDLKGSGGGQIEQMKRYNLLVRVQVNTITGSLKAGTRYTVYKGGEAASW